MFLSTLRRGASVLRPHVSNAVQHHHRRRPVVTYRNSLPARSWLSSSASASSGDNDDGSSTETPDDVPKETPEVPPPVEVEEDTAAEEAAPEELEPAAAVVDVDLEASLRPSDVVTELDKHIVGQQDAKRAVAIAMRNRWRRRQIPKELRKEVTPRNVLMIGPTGCGKTEVARRMAALGGAPFIKVEATKFTEVGYHGRDVDQIIRDLMDISINLTKKRFSDKFKGQAKESVEERILDLLVGETKNRSKESFRSMLRDGHLEDEQIFVDVPEPSGDKNNVFAMGDGNNPNMAAMSDLLSRMAGPGGRKQPMERKQLPIKEAREVLLEIELEKLLDTIDIKKEAITAVEESGIVFIDEIDKICSSKDFMSRSADASAEGVQRDLLPLVEGTTISTKYGNVNTDYILFVASGAFHAVKPSDMLPELQGRLPIRVELQGLSEDDLYKILTEPVANLIKQQVELIGTEGVKLTFEEDAIREIARMGAMLNKTVENIGARRLHTVIERIMENLSFEAAELENTGKELVVNKELVEERLSEVTVKSDLSRYIL